MMKKITVLICFLLLIHLPAVAQTNKQIQKLEYKIQRLREKEQKLLSPMYDKVSSLERQKELKEGQYRQPGPKLIKIRLKKTVKALERKVAKYNKGIEHIQKSNQKSIDKVEKQIATLEKKIQDKLRKERLMEEKKQARLEKTRQKELEKEGLKEEKKRQMEEKKKARLEKKQQKKLEKKRLKEEKKQRKLEKKLLKKGIY